MKNSFSIKDMTVTDRMDCYASEQRRLSFFIKNHLSIPRICIRGQSITNPKGQISQRKRDSLYRSFSATLMIIALATHACSARQASEATSTVTTTKKTRAIAISHFPRSTVISARTPTPPSPTHTPILVTLTTTVWPREPLVPILLYHYFILDQQESKDFTQIRLSDFQTQLERLFNAGYSLIQVEEWLKGNMVVPSGRRPLAITMDDLFDGSQLEFDNSGNPSPDSGLGVLWQFSQEHPDFGFEVMLFANFGAQLYGVKNLEERKLKQANAVVWCMEHGARIYNHTFNHIDLQHATAEELAEDLRMHDTYLREILALAGREDLIHQLGNMFAVPYSFPLTFEEYAVLHEYTTPEGVPMQAAFSSAYYQSAPPMPPPYKSGFDTYNIMRFEVNNDALIHLVRNKDNYPAAQTCTLTSLEESQITDPTYLSEQIGFSVSNGSCPLGIYVIDGLIFDAQTPTVVLLYSSEIT